MNKARRADLDLQAVVKAFDAMGRYLHKRDLLGEIAIYGGSSNAAARLPEVVGQIRRRRQS